MKNVYTLKCTQLAPEYKENKEIIEYEDTLEKYESVTSEEYIRSRKSSPIESVALHFPIGSHTTIALSAMTKSRRGRCT